ncbi:helix-turn-helix domain-containing protein [Streptomyces sp. KPB2]|uniref:GlxA family transcriptional regulator n=1 Tax=unclassified Streptomyces TaxID=2593676 RepID=UPI000F71D774|nr:MULTISPECIES: helix-turn-helix domain-containing protein [unclassified Streptomyces]AZM73855.1 helix-turn-helix domain-containing protein [Streptomyces sp. KPB2]MBH5135691.1 helix-turn-helix domain-containing protein [Streptomyces sp. HB-N217]
MHSVAILVLDDVVPLDMAAPMQAFDWTRLPDGRKPYRVGLCAESAEVRTDSPHTDAIRVPAPAARRSASRTRSEGGPDSSQLGHRYPRVEVRPDVLYVDNGQILTSAGAAAGLDMCLHMIRRDLGSAVAADTARMCVVPLEREGGQAQFIAHERPPVPRGSDLEPLLRWIEDNLAGEVTLGAMAARSGMSERTFSRRFREQTGTTPLQWLPRARVRRAQYLLENGDEPVERIARRAGFGSPTAFRERFRRVVGTTPYAYRAAFRAKVPTSPEDS